MAREGLAIFALLAFGGEDLLGTDREASSTPVAPSFKAGRNVADEIEDKVGRRSDGKPTLSSGAALKRVKHDVHDATLAVALGRDGLEILGRYERVAAAKAPYERGIELRSTCRH